MKSCQNTSSSYCNKNPPIIRNGAAKFIPINSIPKYMARPKAAQVAMTAETLPISPSQGLDFTASPIMQVITLQQPKIYK